MRDDQSSSDIKFLLVWFYPSIQTLIKLISGGSFGRIWPGSMTFCGKVTQCQFAAMPPCLSIGTCIAGDNLLTRCCSTTDRLLSSSGTSPGSMLFSKENILIACLSLLHLTQILSLAIFISKRRSLQMEQNPKLYNICSNSKARIQSVVLLYWGSDEIGGGAGRSTTLTCSFSADFMLVLLLFFLSVYLIFCFIYCWMLERDTTFSAILIQVIFSCYVLTLK